MLLQFHSFRSALLVPVHFDGQIIDSNHHRRHCSRHTHRVDQSTDYRANESTQEDEVSCGHIILKTLFLTFFGRKLQQKRKDQEETLREAKEKAESFVKLMEPAVARKREEEEAKGGLIIQHASYGRLPQTNEVRVVLLNWQFWHFSKYNLESYLATADFRIQFYRALTHQ